MKKIPHQIYDKARKLQKNENDLQQTTTTEVQAPFHMLKDDNTRSDTTSTVEV